jgi:hypothetical protein
LFVRSRRPTSGAVAWINRYDERTSHSHVSGINSTPSKGIRRSSLYHVVGIAQCARFGRLIITKLYCITKTTSAKPNLDPSFTQPPTHANNRHPRSRHSWRSDSTANRQFNPPTPHRSPYPDRALRRINRWPRHGHSGGICRIARPVARPKPSLHRLCG